MKNKMAKPLGFSPATKHRAASVRVCIPLDLQAAYGGRKDFRLSLGMGDTATLRAKANTLRKQKDDEFAAKLKALKEARTLTPVVKVSPVLGEAIATGVYAAALAQDDSLRDTPEGQAILAEVVAAAGMPYGAALTIGPTSPEAPSDGGLTDAEAETLAGLNAIAEGKATIANARRRLIVAQPEADKVARAMGLEVDWTSPSGQEALRASLGALRDAWRDRGRRDQGENIQTPSQASPQEIQAAANPHTLWDVLDQWKGTNSPSRTHVSKTTSAVRMVDACLGPKALADYTKPEGATVVAHMLTHCKAQKTAKDYFDNVKALLNYADSRLGSTYIVGNPWKGHSVTVKRSRPRVNLPSDVLVKL